MPCPFSRRFLAQPGGGYLATSLATVNAAEGTSQLRDSAGFAPDFPRLSPALRRGTPRRLERGNVRRLWMRVYVVSSRFGKGGEAEGGRVRALS